MKTHAQTLTYLKEYPNAFHIFVCSQLVQDLHKVLNIKLYKASTQVYQEVCVRVRVCVCDHSFVWLGLILCTLIRYLGFMGILFYAFSMII